MIEKEREDKIMFNSYNESNGGGHVMSSASSINTGESPKFITTSISSLEDADRFVRERISSDGSRFACYLGEDIIINNTIWQVVGIDTELYKGDIPLTQHHITLVPKTIIGVSPICSNNYICNGYANSDMMFAKTIPNVETLLESVLGEHLLTRRVKLTNVVGCEYANAKSVGTGYYSVKANLMCQMQVFGTIDGNYGNVYDMGEDCAQLPGFATGKVSKAINNWYWLRDVYGYDGSTYYFTSVDSDGSLYAHDVDGCIGVRPLITIG